MNITRKQAWCAAALIAAVSAMGAQQVQTQPPPSPQPAGATQPANPGRGGWQGPMDEARARQLYVSNAHEDHGRSVNFERQMQAKAETDKRYAEVTKGIVDYQKISYRSSVGDLDIPAYLFQPLKKRGRGCPAGC